MNEHIEPSSVVFFLGAGASVAAEVPHTYAFVDEFQKNIKEPEKRKVLDAVISKLEAWRGSKIDIELLLETLTKLQKKDEEPLLQFFKLEFLLKGYSEKEPLINDLKDFIKKKAIVSEEKIIYLQPLLDFIYELKSVDIVSLNYDTCIEQFCNAHKLTYQDGFDVHWNPKTFGAENTDIRLYKLHGSVMWYHSDRGNYIKLPVMTEESKIRLITGESADNLMLYPMQKWDYAEPLLELLVLVKQILESNKCKTVIVVGYSFRDEHIARMLWDSARRNKDLHVVLVDPHAFDVYADKLKYYDKDAKIPSSLDGRVICLPYHIEKILPFLKNYYLKNLIEGLAKDAELHAAKSRGEMQEWTWLPVLRLLANAEFVEKCEKIMKDMEPVDVSRTVLQDEPTILEIWLKLAINSFINKQSRTADRYLRQFVGVLDDMVYAMHVYITPPIINFNFNEVAVHDIKRFVRYVYYLAEYCRRACELGDLDKKIRAKIELLSNGLVQFASHIGPLESGAITLDNYVAYREHSDIEKVRKEEGYLKNGGTLSAEAIRELQLTLLGIEREQLSKILGNMPSDFYVHPKRTS